MCVTKHLKRKTSLFFPLFLQFFINDFPFCFSSLRDTSNLYSGSYKTIIYFEQSSAYIQMTNKMREKKVCDKWVRNSNCVRLCQLDCKTFKGMKSTGYEIPMVSLIHLKRIWSYMTEEKVYTHTNQKKQCPVALRAEFKWAVELIAAHLFDPYRSLYHYIDLPHICNLQKVFLLMMPFFPPKIYLSSLRTRTQWISASSKFSSSLFSLSISQCVFLYFRHARHFSL